MTLAVPVAQRSLWRRLALLGAGLLLWSCSEQLAPTGLIDSTPPTVTIKKTSDTVDINQGLTFTVTAGDNISLKAINVTITGAATATFDTTFSTTTTTFSRQFVISVGAGTAGGRVRIVAKATDGAGNIGSASDSVVVFDGQPPTQTLLRPVANATYGPGDTITAIVRASDPSGVAKLGAQIFTTDPLGVINRISADSVVHAPPPVLVTDTIRVVIPPNLKAGTYSLGSFAVDNVGNRGVGTPVNILVKDVKKPTITFMLPTPGFRLRAPDSVRVQVRVQDNTGVASLTLTGIAHRGDPNLGTNVDVVRYLQKTVTLPQAVDTTITRDLNFKTGDQTAEFVYIVAVAKDSSGNTAQDSVQVEIVSGPQLTILAPLNNSVVSPGKSITVTIRGVGVTTGVRKLGFSTTGVLSTVDSSFVLPTTNPQVRDTTASFTLTVPAATALGTFTIAPFGRDSLGSIGTGAGVVVQVVSYSIATDNTPPLVTDSLGIRDEARDTIKVRATDPGGIRKVGFTVKSLTGAFISGDSVLLPGSATDVSRAFSLKLDTLTAFPRIVVVEAFAEDSVGNRGVLSRTGLPLSTGGAADTITIVAGITVRLPSGGRVADAIYNRNRNEFYLTNVDLDRLEVFKLIDTSFVVGGIPVGSRPWGIALWPRDTLGNNGDTVVVANSGGTNLSVVDVSAARRERRRHALPNFLIEKASLVRDQQTNAIVDVKLTDFEFSDRPENLGTVCRVTTGSTACAPDSIYAVYSTTPTPSQTSAFQLRGSMRWENLTTQNFGNPPESHLFWEHARPSSGPDTLFEFADTVQIVADGGGRAAPEILLGASCFVSMVLDNLAFRDTTYVRNSGNFTHALVGEGGNTPSFARALGFNAAAGVTSTACPNFGSFLPASIRLRENGVSPGRYVSDFIGNTATAVRSIATNFNGKTNLVRADSIYVLDEGLRLTGLVQSSGQNYGMDLNFDHKFNAGAGGTAGTDGGTLDPNSRFVFAARGDANIDVFDTWFYGRVTTIPIKDPIIGPLRVAKLASGEQAIIGVTSRGVVVAKLPAITNIYPAPWTPVQ